MLVGVSGLEKPPMPMPFVDPAIYSWFVGVIGGVRHPLFKCVMKIGFVGVTGILFEFACFLDSVHVSAGGVGGA